MILLDTSILVYAVGSEHPLREACRRLLAARAAGLLSATTPTEVVQEFAHVFARRRDRKRTASIARDYVTALSPIATHPDDLSRGLELFEAHPELGAFDAVLAAVAVGHDATLISADRSFSVVPGLKWMNPGTPEIDALLEAATARSSEGETAT